MSTIDPMASVHPDAQLGEAVSIGPFCVVEAGVVIGDRCTLHSRATIKRGTSLGCDNQVFEGAVLGGRPQHLHAGSELGQLIIGNGNHFRENTTLHCGLEPGKDTVIGNHNFLMVGVHIAHDCHVGNNVIMANNTMLGGHVSVGDRAFLSGNVAAHQFSRIGKLAMVGGQARVTRDIPPFVMIDGQTSTMVGLNRVGLRRAGFTQEQRDELKAAYRAAFCTDLPWDEMMVSLQARFNTGVAAEFAEFLTGGTRGFVRDRRGSQAKTLKLHAANEAPPALSEYRKAG